MNPYNKIPYNQIPQVSVSEMLPPDVTIEDLFTEDLNCIDFPKLTYRNGKFESEVDGFDPSELEGVILYYRRQRGRFRKETAQIEGEKFLCQSLCGKKGHTDVKYADETGPSSKHPEEGIDCNSCAFSRFTSGSSFQVCRKQIKLYFLVKGHCVPYTLFLDQEATETFLNQYLMQLTMKYFSYPTVLTRLSVKNKRAIFEVIGKMKGKELREIWLSTIKKDDTMDEIYFKHSFPNGNITTCFCNLWQGCTCGMMQRERISKTTHRG